MGDDFSIGHIKHPGMLVLRFGVRDAPELQRTWRNVWRTTRAQLDDTLRKIFHARSFQIGQIKIKVF